MVYVQTALNSLKVLTAMEIRVTRTLIAPRRPVSITSARCVLTQEARICAMGVFVCWIISVPQALVSTGPVDLATSLKVSYAILTSVWLIRIASLGLVYRTSVGSVPPPWGLFVMA